MAVYKNLKIFLVDDDPFCLAIYQQHLDNMGYREIACFNDDISCIDNLLHQPDVIFLDYNLGDISGVDVLKTIKQFNPDIYVIFISGREDVETSARTLKHGAFDFIIKKSGDTEKIKQTLMRIEQIQHMLYHNRANSSRRYD